MTEGGHCWPRNISIRERDMSTPQLPGRMPNDATGAPDLYDQQGQDSETITTPQQGARNVLDFGGDEIVQKAAMRANDLVQEWQDKLTQLGVKVVMGGSLASGLALPRAVHDMDVRFLYDGDRTAIVSKIEQATGLSFRKTITLAEGKGRPGWDAHLLEGMLSLDGFTFEVEGALRNSSYTGWAQYYPEVLSPKELADARQRKMELREDKAAYKAFKDELLRIVKQRMRAKGLLDIED